MENVTTCSSLLEMVIVGGPLQGKIVQPYPYGVGSRPAL
jgi:hypothetical protein